MVFKDILLEYYLNLNLIKRDIKKNGKSFFDVKELRYQNTKWFHYVRCNLCSYHDLCKEITDKRTLNRKEFLLPKNERCPGCEDGRPYKVIKYRNIMIPVYDDDYGQQDFTIVFNTTISGGCYNTEAYLEFINYVDHELEKKFLEDAYDMGEEISDLFADQNKEQ